MKVITETFFGYVFGGGANYEAVIMKLRFEIFRNDFEAFTFFIVGNSAGYASFVGIWDKNEPSSWY